MALNKFRLQEATAIFKNTRAESTEKLADEWKNVHLKLLLSWGRRSSSQGIYRTS